MGSILMSPFGMLHTNAKEEHANATRAKVREEMAKPPMARSTRKTELNLDTARTPEQPSTTVAGTVDKIIPPSHAGQPEQAQIGRGPKGVERNYRPARMRASSNEG